MHDLALAIVRGAEADALLGGDEFTAQWSRLAGQCPWATAFQTVGFARAWYHTYRARWEPLLVLSRDSDGSLLGLLPLAVSLADGGVAVAGTHQAEYHAWICRPELGDAFAAQAVQAVRPLLPRRGLKFCYLPPGAPLGWLARGASRHLCLLKSRPRPLMRFGDGTDVSASLNKGGNKSRLRRLKKLGGVDLRRLGDPAEFRGMFDEVVHWYDARRMAVNGSAPFRNDLLKKPFHLEMMAVPGLLHVTVLKFGDQIASAHVNTCAGKGVQLGLIAHNPTLARHSPGKLHILLLAQMLMRDGYEQLDLTPGGEPYKDRFANAWDEVHTLTVLPTAAARLGAALGSGLEGAAKSALRACRVSPADVKSLAQRVRGLDARSAPAALLAAGRQRVYCRRETRVYRLDAADAPDPEPSSLFHRNSASDLLAYRPLPGLPTRRQFVSTALARIEAGQHLYTCADEAGLLHFGWLAERVTEDVAVGALGAFPLPPDCALVVQFYTVPRARGRGLAALCLRTMVADAAAVPGTRAVFAGVPAGSDAARRVVEKSGFRYAGSVFERTTLGRTRRWAAVTARPAAEPALT